MRRGATSQLSSLAVDSTTPLTAFHRWYQREGIFKVHFLRVLLQGIWGVSRDSAMVCKKSKITPITENSESIIAENKRG